LEQAVSARKEWPPDEDKTVLTRLWEMLIVVHWVCGKYGVKVGRGGKNKTTEPAEWHGL